jgi:OHCU decarboxylase
MDEVESRQSEISNLKWLNQLPFDDAIQQLIQCCGSRNWASGVVSKRPFRSLAEIIQTADEVWWQLDETDWLEAFKAHPRIGEKKADTAGTARSESWAKSEQAGMSSAHEQTAEKLARFNREYEAKFGYIFIVCATGKSPDEMLALLVERLQHDASDELPVAAAEQAKITKLRLAKLFSTA